MNWIERLREPGRKGLCIAVGFATYLILGVVFIYQTDFLPPWQLWLWNLPARVVGPFFGIPPRPLVWQLGLAREVLFLISFPGLLSGVILGFIPINLLQGMALALLPPVVLVVLFGFVLFFVGGHGPAMQFLILPCLVSIPYSILGAMIGWGVSNFGCSRPAGPAVRTSERGAAGG